MTFGKGARRTAAYYAGLTPCIGTRAMPPRLILALALAVALSLATAQVPPPRDVPYAPGPITVEVDATNLAQRIMRVRQTIPVASGPLTLLYPAWLPGNHAPRGPIDKVAGLRFRTADGQALPWTRDPTDVYAFHLDIPAGVSRITADFEYLTPTDGSQGRVVMTPSMLNLQWNAVMLYPAGHAMSKIEFRPRVKYPAGWQAGTALDVESRAADNTIEYRPVSAEILADSPVYAGRHFKRIDLTPSGRRPVHLNVVADDPKYLEAKDAQIEQHREMVVQSLKLFGSEHYDHYDFLLSLSSQMAGNGLEHQRSSENGQPLGYFRDWNPKDGSDDLLPHEMTHSWNGKYLRPAEQVVPNLNTPLQDSLLWVYEGQTQYWGNVLAARSGMRPMDRSRDELAMVVATYRDNRPGLGWRSVLDTTHDPIVSARRPKPYRNYQMSEDYYRGGQLIWLGVDALIREQTGGRKSLDDFARAFFGVNDGQWESPVPYTFDDVVAALHAVHPYDWKRHLSDRVEGRVPFADSIEATGWRLVYRDEPNGAAKAAKRVDGDFTYSLGLTLGKDGKVIDTRWDGPAFDAGIGTGMNVVAVNDVEYDSTALAEAIRAAKGGQTSIRLLVKDFNRYRTVSIGYHDGLRYPALERIPGRTDRLSAILAARR